MSSSPQIQSTREYRQPLQRISESKMNSNPGSIYSGAVRVLRKEKQSPPKLTVTKNQHQHQHQNNQHNQHQKNETHYMQSTESSRYLYYFYFNF